MFFMEAIKKTEKIRLSKKSIRRGKLKTKKRPNYRAKNTR